MNINLLPWRTSIQKKQQRQFLITLTALLISLALILLILHLVLIQKISQQKALNEQLIRQLNTLKS